ncbi:MAG: DUF3500 domain-containing protein [Planctomycetes bacterium]|nr:DUF3500 domain-containing protein [Planctomycetota bacterium]
MIDKQAIECPECKDPAMVDRATLDRRGFMQTVGATTSLLAVGGAAPRLFAGGRPAQGERQAKPAEALIRELYQGLSDEQKRQVCMPWNHGAGNNQLATRLRFYNAPINQHRIGTALTRPQQELCQRILRSISSGEDGYRLLSRNGTFDGSGSFGGCGAYIFGDPTNNGQFAWVFAGHHLTVRCDGNSEPDAAFGGPMYYGHSPDGYSQRNCFYYQTRSVLSVFDALTEAQRRQAIVIGSPGEGDRSVQFRNDNFPGLAASDLTADQRRLIESVMRDVLSPYRREDADEVMQIVRRNGGLDRIHLAFYRDGGATDNNWHFWRLEGPGFVWNYRVLPHVHTYVNIAVPRRENQG